MKIFASFVVAPLKKGKFAATTRPDGRLGLPGGKVEPGETPKDAALREAEEEGWHIPGPLQFHHTAMVEGKLVAWFTTPPGATKLRVFKEKARGIRPVAATGKDLASHGMGNQFLYDLNQAW